MGLSLESAQALCAGLEHRPWSDEALARAALTVTTALLAASPRVAWAAGAQQLSDLATRRLVGAWWVDAAGLGDEKRLAQKLLRIGKDLSYGPVRVGVADAAIAAYAATFRSPIARVDRLTVCVPSGRNAAFLASYPLSLLELDEDLEETLRALGLVTLGALAQLDADEVEARFGAEGLAAHRLARGSDTRGPSLPRDDDLPAVECDLGAPVATAEPLLFVLKGALGSLGEALRGKGLAARELIITLRLDNGSAAERVIRPARPTSHEAALFDHVRGAFENWLLDEPVCGLVLRATLTVPAAGEQGSLLISRWADPGALGAAFDRIRGSEGAGAVSVPRAQDGHLPLDQGSWGIENQGDRKGFSVARSPGSSIPRSALRLLENPLPVRVRLGRAGLEAFREGERWRDLAGWSGPEHLAPRWWRREGNGDTRDYFTVRTREGLLCLLFRSGREPQWFVEGWWD